MVMPLGDLTWSLGGCPSAPGWQLDWERLRALYPWLGTLKDVPQDPIYHAEGDVLTHTGMVAEALASLAAWRALPPTERAVVFAAALLHDIGKASCTIIEPDGRISSRGHARRGAQLARELLWTNAGFGAPLPLAIRERIVALVRLHGLPLWFLDKGEIERAIFAASYRANLSEVALLAEADARGRECHDQAELLARIELFRELCAEHSCLERPRPFPNDHSRVRYFRGQQANPGYQAYDDTWGEVVVMAGLPGVGKDTWLRQHASNLPVVSLDAIRAQLGVRPEEAQGAVVQAAKEQARTLLRARQPFAWNATNLSRQLRGSVIGLLLAYGARCRVVYLDAPLEQVLERNRARVAPVPQGVIVRLVSKLDLPDLTEAHQVQFVVT